MADLNGNGIDDRWEPYWIDDLHPDDKSALQTTFAGIAPESLVQHDMPADQSAALGLPASGVEQAQATAPTMGQPLDPYAPSVTEQGWNPQFTQAPPSPEQAAPAPMQFAQPGTGLPQGVVDNAVAPHVADYLGDGPGAVGDAPHIETNAEKYAADPLSNPNDAERDAAIEQMALHDPVGFAKMQAAHQFASEQKTALAAAQAAKDDREQMEAIEKVRADAQAATDKKMAALNAQAADIHSRKVDPGSYMKNRSSVQALLDVIGSVAGAYAGGPNQYVAMMQHRIDADIDAQVADIENAARGVGVAKGLLADEYARTGDLYQSAQAVRIAAKTAARDKIVADQQQYDPKGTRSLMLGKAAAEMTSAIAAGQQAHAQKEFDNHIKEGELQLKAYAEKRLRKKDANELLLKQQKMASGGAGSRAAPRPILMPADAWYAQNKMGDSDAARSAYQAYSDNVGRAQSVWDSRNAGGSGSGSGGGAVTFSQGAPTSSGAAATPATAAGKYSSEGDWFAKERPGAKDDERKQYWFVDGNSGNDAPPIKIASVEDPQKFGKRQRIRQQMGVKADQLLVLMGRLQKKGLWSTMKNKVNWAQDEDAMEARSLAEDLTGDGIQAKEMGVPSGSDIERVKTMFGGDPAGWKDQSPALQRARETMQIEQDADWKTNAPAAFNDKSGVYNKYRVLPTASPDWLKKVNGRGIIKEVAPEMANTDPKQLAPKPVEGDAPNVEGAKSIEERTANLTSAADWLEDSGAVPSADDDNAAASLGVGTSSRAKPTPQVSDYKYQGAPEGSESFEKLRTQYVNSVANLNEYQRTHDPKLWKAFQTNQKEIADALPALITTEDIPRSQRKSGDWRKDSAALAHLAGVVLRRGGKR